MVRRAAAAGALALTLTGCASAQETAADDLQTRLDGVHESFLEWRAEDPTSADEADLPDRALHTSVEDDRITVVLPIGAYVQTGGGLFYEEASLGACVLVSIEVGDGPDDRGSVATGPVECPDGTTTFPDQYGHDQQMREVTTDLEARRDDVPEPEPHYEPCISGEVCDHGGG